MALILISWQFKSTPKATKWSVWLFKDLHVAMSNLTWTCGLVTFEKLSDLRNFSIKTCVLILWFLFPKGCLFLRNNNVE